MKALQWKNNILQVNDVALPERGEGEARLRVICAGICNTDLEIIRGYHGFQGTLGHEFVGVVEDCTARVNIGRRVVCDINCVCHACPYCDAGNPHHCQNRVTVGINGKDGAFAEYINVPSINMFVLPESLPTHIAVFAEPVAAALEILEQVPCRAGDEVAVIGDGKLGLLITMCLADRGLCVSLVGHHPERLSVLEGCEIEYHAQPPKRKFPLVIEATGQHTGFTAALALTAPRGRLVLKSTYAQGFTFNPAPLVVDEIALLGSRCGPMEKSVALLASGRIHPERLIEQSFPLAEGVAAIRHARTKGVLKVLLDFA